jgi:glycosyltransferase involved in cell wall biosynthesis
LNRFVKAGKKEDEKMDLPKISIITPSFNQGHFIEQTILSVLNQNYPNLEYIIIDGGSMDDTVSIIRKYESKIHYWVSEKDNGQSDAINKGLKICTGDIIAYINSDDMYENDTFVKIINRYNEIAHKKALIYGKFKVIDEKNTILWQPNDLNDELKLVKYSSFELLQCWKYTIPQPSTFWTREVLNEIGYFDTSLHFSMDLDYWLRVIQSNIPIYQVNSVYSYFRRHDSAKSSLHVELLKQNLLHLKSKYLCSFFIKVAYSAKFYIWFKCTSQINEAITLIIKGEKLKAIKLLFKATLCFPFAPFFKIKLYAVFLKNTLKWLY